MSIELEIGVGLILHYSFTITSYRDITKQVVLGAWIQ